MPTTRHVTNNPASERAIIPRPVSNLLLDPQNPRLTLEPNASQDAILKRMYIDEALEELASSFSRNGYFWEEPLVVVPSGKASDKFIVVEGNRRLAAIKLLTDATLRKKLNVTDFPELTAKRETELKSVPTVAYSSREDIVPYLGFRHITGVKKWEPFAKARYVAGLINSGVPISQIEESIGDEARTVKKLYQTFIVYKQVEDDLDLDTKEVRSNFSLLEVTLGQQPIKDLLGVPRELPKGITETVVPKKGLAHLKELISWVYGDPSSGELRVITDSRQISKRLAPVIANDESREYLRKTRDLEGAYERSGGERQYYLRQLTAAGRAVERALGIASLYKGDEEIVSQVERLATLVDALAREARAA
jgi:hypothetical protein